MIDVLIPNYFRPKNVLQIYNSLRLNTSCEYKLTFIQERDDLQGQAEVAKLGCRSIVGNFDSYGNAINTGYFLTNSPFIFPGVDDIDFTPAWDVEPLRMLHDNRPELHVIGLCTKGADCPPDGIFSCHFVIRRSYVREHSLVTGMPNLLMYPYYHHELDRELCWTARTRGIYESCPQSVIMHHQEFDETQKKTISKDDIDRHTYNERRHLFRGA